LSVFRISLVHKDLFLEIFSCLNHPATCVSAARRGRDERQGRRSQVSLGGPTTPVNPPINRINGIVQVSNGIQHSVQGSRSRPTQVTRPLATLTRDTRFWRSFASSVVFFFDPCCRSGLLWAKQAIGFNSARSHNVRPVIW